MLIVMPHLRRLLARQSTVVHAGRLERRWARSTSTIGINSTKQEFRRRRRRRPTSTVVTSIQQNDFHRSFARNAVTSASDALNDDTQYQFELFNSLSQRLEPLLNQDDDDAGLAWYTCGPTVYAPAHLGHARTYVCMDILRRVLEYNYQQQQSTGNDQANGPSRPPPLFVLNITDVDDKILAAANENNEPPLDLARRYELEFWKDWDALNCLRPHIVTRVTEHVEADIVPYIQRIVDQGLAYVVDSDGVYFDVRAFEETSQDWNSSYGKLTSGHKNNNGDDAPITASGVATESQKQDPRDFALWKLHKPGEKMHWPSPWGDGRPGWHIECSAMIASVEQQIDNSNQRQKWRFHVHAGGVDLQFPHHSNEIAQAEAHRYATQQLGENSNASSNRIASGSCCSNHQNLEEEWIPFWVHTGHLHIDGMKMSKSLKNFVTIQDLLTNENDNNTASAGAWASPADDFRWWCLGLAGSYRGPATYTPRLIEEAQRMRCEKVCKLLHQGQEWIDKQQIGLHQRDAVPATSLKGRKKWNDADWNLFATANQTKSACIQALNSDLDGTTFVKLLVQLVELCFAYMRESDTSETLPPDEPLRHTLQIVRHLLSLVGFSDVTTRAGLAKSKADGDQSTDGVVGGEAMLLDEVARFRSAIRDIALNSMDQKDPARREMLELCDSLRESTFPVMGVELYDGSSTATWSYCVPRSITSKQSNPTKTPLQRLEDIALHDFFRVGPYEGKFSIFDTETGFPTHNADGTELSKNQQKKLKKKHTAHAQRLAKKAQDKAEQV